MDKSATPKITEMLSGDVPLRDAWPSELEFFRCHLEIAGMAADDDFVVINPFLKRSNRETRSVKLNEAARVFMRREGLIPTFELTDAQKAAFASYGPIQSIKETVAARILSGDPSSLTPTSSQLEFVTLLRTAMGLHSGAAEDGDT